MQSSVSAATAAGDASHASWESSDAEIDSGVPSTSWTPDFGHNSSRSSTDVIHVDLSYMDSSLSTATMSEECIQPYRNQLHELDCILAKDSRYSIKLYGAPGRLPKAEHANLNQLRMVWMSLLSKESQESLTGLGVCLEKANLNRKLFVSNVHSIPPASIWNHLPRATWSENGFRDNTWVEVTHCGFRKESLLQLLPLAVGKMWFYGAPGSGISINLRKTANLGFISTSAMRDPAFHYILEDHLERFDSVQMLHQSIRGELFWEIVLASPECGECESLTTASAHLSQRLKCGRDPYWIPCSHAKGSPLDLLEDCNGLAGMTDKLIDASSCPGALINSSSAS